MDLTTQESQSLFALGPIQPDFNTFVAPSASPKNFRPITKEGYDFGDVSSTDIDNAGFSTGSAYATKNQKGNHDSAFVSSERATFQGLGIAAIDSFGSYPTPVTLAPGVGKHQFELLDPYITNTLPARTVVEKSSERQIATNNVIDRRLLSMVVESASFVSGSSPDMRININRRGSGKVVRPSGVLFGGAGAHVKADEDIAENFIQSTMAAFELFSQPNAAGTKFAAQCAFRDVSITIEEGLNTEIGYNGCGKLQNDADRNSGAVRGQLPATRQVATVEFSLLFTPEVLASFNPETRFETGQEFSTKLIYLGNLIDATHAHKATFSVNRAVIQSLSFPPIDGVRGVRIGCKLLAQKNKMPLSLELITNVADFNTYVG